MARLAVNASPFDCRWIQPGSEMRVIDWTYAICLRMPDLPRPVSELECERCAWWEEPNDKQKREK